MLLETEAPYIALFILVGFVILDLYRPFELNDSTSSTNAATATTTTTNTTTTTTSTQADQMRDTHFNHARVNMFLLADVTFCIAVGTAYAVWRYTFLPSQPIMTREILALILGVFGGSLRAWSRYTLGRFFTYVVGIRSGHTLIITGPYRFLRHPSYTGGLLVHLALLWYTTTFWFALLFVSVGATLMVKRIRNEEAVLVEEFGDLYRERQRRVARLIPYIY